MAGVVGEHGDAGLGAGAEGDSVGGGNRNQYGVRAGDATGCDVSGGQGTRIDADFIVGDVGVGVVAELRAAEPVVNVFDLIEAEVGVEEADLDAIAIPGEAPAGGRVGTDAGAEGGNEMVTGA